MGAGPATLSLCMEGQPANHSRSVVPADFSKDGMAVMSLHDQQALFQDIDGIDDGDSLNSRLGTTKKISAEKAWWPNDYALEADSKHNSGAILAPTGQSTRVGLTISIGALLEGNAGDAEPKLRPLNQSGALAPGETPSHPQAPSVPGTTRSSESRAIIMSVGPAVPSIQLTKMRRETSPSAAVKQDQRGGAGIVQALSGSLVDLDSRTLGILPPGVEERSWIQFAVRNMFSSLSAEGMSVLLGAFRELQLPPCRAIVKQGSPINTGPGLCVLFDGVVDVLHSPSGSTEPQKVCTYDRRGQCFGEIQLFFDTPSGGGPRRQHWATISTRTKVTLWAVNRADIRGRLFGATSSTRPEGLPASPMANARI